VTSPAATRAVVPYHDQVASALAVEEGQLVSLLEGTVPIERFRQVVLHTIARNPDLQRASLPSVLDAIRVAATLKLEPTGILGEGYLIRYGQDAQFEAGYRGLMKLARRSGEVAIIDAQVVYENDHFKPQLGTEPRIEHVPADGDRGSYRGAYAWARLRSGELKVEWLTYAEIEKVRKVSRNGQGSSSPWVSWWGEMARKTALKRLMKQLPLGSDADAALRHEATLDEIPTVSEQPASDGRPIRGAARARAALGLTPGTTGALGQPAATAAASTDATADAPPPTGPELAGAIVEGNAREDVSRETTQPTAAGSVSSWADLRSAFQAAGRGIPVGTIKDEGVRLFPGRDLEMRSPSQWDRDLTAAEWTQLARALGVGQ
jgi:recombination protein RecT